MASSSPNLLEGYTLRTGVPEPDAYIHLRKTTGLSPKTATQARLVAQGTWYGCFITFQAPCPSLPSSDTSSVASGPAPAPPPEELVGMGRIIADGAWYFHIVDIAVHPGHQRRGLGDLVFKELIRAIRKQCCLIAAQEEDGAQLAKPYICLLADPPGRKLYAKNGFVPTERGSGPNGGGLGMMLEIGDDWLKP